jgi:hypothetical protein
MDEITINNAIGLLEECITNGKSGKDILYAWFLEEQVLITSTIRELTIEQTGTIVKILKNYESCLSDGYKYYCGEDQVDKTLKELATDIIESL